MADNRQQILDLEIDKTTIANRPIKEVALELLKEKGIDIDDYINVQYLYEPFKSSETNAHIIITGVPSTKNKFKSYQSSLDELKAHYQKGGLGDVKIKKFLVNVMEEVLEPIRERRHYYEKRIPEVLTILEEGTKEANEFAHNTLEEVKEAIGLNYFNDKDYLEEQIKKYQ